MVSISNYHCDAISPSLHFYELQREKDIKLLNVFAVDAFTYSSQLFLQGEA